MQYQVYHKKRERSLVTRMGGLQNGLGGGANKALPIQKERGGKSFSLTKGSGGGGGGGGGERISG